jgi:hypothetical protein
VTAEAVGAQPEPGLYAIATGFGPATIRSTTSGRETRIVGDPNSINSPLAFSPDGALLAVGV